MALNEGQLQLLLSRWIDGSISSGDLRELQETLAADAEARRLYFDFMDVHAALVDTATAREHLEYVLLSYALPTDADCAVRGPASGSARSRVMLAVAATLLLALGAWSLVSFGGGRTAKEGDLDAARGGALLAQVVSQSRDCQWYVEHASEPAAEALRSGDTLRVVSGKLRLQYPSGVQVLLYAPAVFELVSDMRAKMILGRLKAVVSEAGQGFTVHTPQANVIDHGTEFGIGVNQEGATDVVVFKGEVDVDYGALGERAGRAQRLRMGEGLRLDAAGTASRIVSITSQLFADDSDATATFAFRPPLIAEVHDNIQRADTWNYYEIVHGGMGEDVLAYVDRIAHQYNGIAKTGMPSYLIGGDYVKTFNNDKFNHDLRIEVTLARPCRLYVLFDNRLDPPTWLADGFRDTGDDVGVDVGPFRTKGMWHNKGPTGVGPGVSVDDHLSVWVREVARPGVVQLGATGAPESGPNMYGIVALPLGATD